MWRKVVEDSLSLAKDFQWIWVDFLYAYVHFVIHARKDFFQGSDFQSKIARFGITTNTFYDRKDHFAPKNGCWLPQTKCNKPFTGCRSYIKCIPNLKGSLFESTCRKMLATEGAAEIDGWARAVCGASLKRT